MGTLPALARSDADFLVAFRPDALLPCDIGRELVGFGLGLLEYSCRDELGRDGTGLELGGLTGGHIFGSIGRLGGSDVDGDGAE